MVLKAQQLSSHPLVRSPAMSKEEAVAVIPHQPARQLFRRVALDPTPVLMLFVCLLFSLLGTEATPMCGVPGRADNGTQISLYPAALYNPGQKAEYSCQPGLALLGDSIRTCQNDGLWSGSRPRCVDNLAYKKAVASSRVVNNYRPDLIVDGNLKSCVYLDTRVVDRFIQIDLKKNHLISGLILHVPDGFVQELTVFIAEKLDSAPGIQYRRCTPRLSQVNAPKVQIECRGEDGPIAIPGRFLHIRDERKIHDFYFALCEIEIYGLPDVPMGCGLPDLPAFAAPANQSQLLEEKHGHMFSPTCQAGFVLHGSKVLRCVDGNWIGSEVTQCVAVECHPLVPVINGQIDLFPVRGLSNNSFNSVARHRCSEGYMIFGGDVTRTCGQDARWTGTPPFCRPTDCQLPRPISNAVYKLVDSHTRPGSIAQYTCFNGYVPQRILADKPLQTVIVCQQNGAWTEGNFHCALRTTYYPPVSISFSTTVDNMSETTEEPIIPDPLDSTTARVQTSSIKEIEFVKPVPITTSVAELIEKNVTPGTDSSLIIASSTDASENTPSAGTAIAATGFVAAFIIFFLMVVVGVALNLCRMRTTFEKARKRFLQASSNLLLIHTSGSSAKDGVCKTASNGGSEKRQIVVKAECEPVYNELDDSFSREPEDCHAKASSSSLSSEQESTYLDIDLDKIADEENYSLKHCTEKSILPYVSHQSESSFTESKPSLTPDEIVLLYAKIDKTKKTRNRVCSNDSESNPPSLDSICKADIDNELQAGRVNKSHSKFGDFHPKKVNELQLPKSVVNVSLNEFVAEHSRIHWKDKNTTPCGLECRPLPALPSQMGKATSAKINEAMTDHNDESDSQNIYATLPLTKP
ncbi:uncharacterized protein LOC130695517 isoform X2 [Daphnia carinata]|uniref:uncharacterized protein LOC130695517 isoform X2 n=1 Tax=Daphnia carinata TaxID=120202 RepID=UPI00257F8D7A|nr:uncharacterized protein LOC130695517 isoform X2 [Daphnia carinata]